MGRGTLSDEHLMGTAAGVMRSRAVRRFQEPARWVPAAVERYALHTVVTTYEEPIEAGRFIEIPIAPTKNPKSETFVTTQGDAEESTKRQLQEVTFREPQQTSSSSGAGTDTSRQIPGPQIVKSCTSVVSR